MRRDMHDSRCLAWAAALALCVPLSHPLPAGEKPAQMPGEKPETAGGLQLLLKKESSWQYWGMAGKSKVWVSAIKPVDEKGEMRALNIQPIDRKAVIVTLFPAMYFKNVGRTPLRLALQELLLTSSGPGWRLTAHAVGPDGVEVPARKQAAPNAPAHPMVAEEKRPLGKTLESGQEWHPQCPLVNLLEFPAPGKYSAWMELTIDPLPGDATAWSGTLRSNRIEWEVKKPEGEGAVAAK